MPEQIRIRPSPNPRFPLAPCLPHPPLPQCISFRSNLEVLLVHEQQRLEKIQGMRQRLATRVVLILAQDSSDPFVPQ